MADPFTRLPTELLHHIIRLAPPSLSFTTYRERYSTLRVCALVSKRWCSIAQHELGKHVYIEHQSEMEDVLSALEAANDLGAVLGGGLRQRVRSVRLGDRVPWRRSEVELLVSYMPLASEMWLSGEVGAIRGLRIRSWCFGDSITSLHLNTATVLPPFTSFPNVETLSIADPPDQALAIHFLRGAALPRLVHLGIDLWGPFDYDADRGEKQLADTVLARLGPQLERLAIRSQLAHFEDLDQFWKSLTALRRLAITMTRYDPSTILGSIPAELTALRLLPYGDIPSSGWEYTETLVANPPSCMQRLRELVLPNSWDLAFKARIQRLCSPRGIVVEDKAVVRDSFFALWEDAATW